MNTADEKTAAAHAMQTRSFDFLYGAWRATERYLTRLGESSTDWREREAFLIARPLLGGMANAEEITYPGNSAFGVATFRCYDIAAAEWIIQSYVYGTSPEVPGMFGASGVLIPALRGRFTEGRGEFVGVSEYAGKAVKVQYVWRNVTALAAQWERWFSFDDGARWEQNVAWSLIRERTVS
jgi:hypothetical protein